MLGSEDGEELLALKRMSHSRRVQTTSLTFFSPEDIGNTSISLHVVFDSICGMDLCIKVPMTTVPAPEGASGGEDEDSESLLEDHGQGEGGGGGDFPPLEGDGEQAEFWGDEA